jgi:hypothetical protein
VKPSSIPNPPVRHITYTNSERVLLTGVPPANRADLLRMLRSSDPAVRGMGLVLVFLDRNGSAPHQVR